MIRNHDFLPKPVHVKSDLEETNSFYYVDVVDVPRFFTNLSSKYKQPIEQFINLILGTLIINEYDKHLKGRI